MQNAIEAAAEALFEESQGLDQDNNWDDALPDEWRQTWLDAAESALYAMLPHLRAMIAQEILSGTNTFIVPPTVRYHDFRSGHATARTDAAQIAKGPQQ